MSPLLPPLSTLLLRPSSFSRLLVVSLVNRLGRLGTRVTIRMRPEGLVRILLLDLFVIATLTKLVDTAVVDLVLPSLEQVDEEDDVVSERG